MGIENHFKWSLWQLTAALSMGITFGGFIKDACKHHVCILLLAMFAVHYIWWSSQNVIVTFPIKAGELDLLILDHSVAFYINHDSIEKNSCLSCRICAIFFTSIQESSHIPNGLSHKVLYFWETYMSNIKNHSAWGCRTSTIAPAMLQYYVISFSG